MADSLKRWWQRRLCMKRARQRWQPSRKRLLNPLQRRVEDEQESEAAGVEIGGADNEPPHPLPPPQPPPPLPPPPVPGQEPPQQPSSAALSRTQFPSVLPRQPSRLQTIREEDQPSCGDADSRGDCSRTGGGVCGGGGCASSREIATAGRSAIDYCPSDDLDSKAIFDSDAASDNDNDSMERNNQTGNNATNAIESVAIVEPDTSVPVEALTENIVPGITEASKTEAFSTSMTRTGTASTQSSSPSPSLASRHSPPNASPGLRRCRRTARQGLRRACHKASGGIIGSPQRRRPSPSVRLEKLTVRPLGESATGCRHRCFEKRGDGVSSDNSYEMDNAQPIACQPPSSSDTYSEAVLGVACALQSSDLDSWTSGAAAKLGSKAVRSMAIVASTNLSNTFGQPTAGVAAEVQAPRENGLKRQSSRITRIWLDQDGNMQQPEAAGAEMPDSSQLRENQRKERNSQHNMLQDKKPDRSPVDNNKTDVESSTPSDSESNINKDSEQDDQPEDKPVKETVEDASTRHRSSYTNLKIKIKRDPRTDQRSSKAGQEIVLHEATVSIESPSEKPVSDDVKVEFEVETDRNSVQSAGDKSDRPLKSDAAVNTPAELCCFDYLPGAPPYRHCNCYCCSSGIDDYLCCPPDAALRSAQHCCCSCSCRNACCSRSSNCGRPHRCCGCQCQRRSCQPVSFSCACACLSQPPMSLSPPQEPPPPMPPPPNYEQSSNYQTPKRYINPHSSAQYALADSREPWHWQPRCERSTYGAEDRTKRTIADADTFCRDETAWQCPPVSGQCYFGNAAGSLNCNRQPPGVDQQPNQPPIKLTNKGNADATQPDRSSLQLTDLALLTSSTADVGRNRSRVASQKSSAASSSGFQSTSFSSSTSPISSAQRESIPTSRDIDWFKNASDRCHISASSSCDSAIQCRRQQRR